MNDVTDVLTDPSALHDPADARRWRETGWWAGQSLASALAENIRRYRDRIAVIGLRAADRADARRRRGAEYLQLTYGDLDSRSALLAERLRGVGVAAGEPVLLHLPNAVEFPIAVAALLRIGALPVFALHSHREHPLAEMAQSCRARVVLTAAEPTPLDEEVMDRLWTQAGCRPPIVLSADLAPPEADRAVADPSTVDSPSVDPASAGLIQLSGGTTGTGKLIPRTHDGYLLSVRRSAEICGLGPDSVLMVTLPASHNFPMSSPGILGAWHVGATVVMAPDPSPRTNLDLVDRYRVTHLSLVPPLARAFVESARSGRHRLDSIAVVGVGGARLPEVVARDVEEVLGGRLQQVFGMAEGLVNYTRLTDPDEVRFTTQGRPLCEADRLRVVDEDGNPLDTGCEGELQTRGPYTITRYLGDSERERSAFTTDGWYRTGDLVVLRPDGNIVVTGRSGDRINRAGEKISASEVEERLLDHPSVLDAVAVGIPDPRLGEQLVVAVTMRDPGADRPDLRAHLKAKGVPAHWLPDRTVVLDALPVTGVGKNSRRDLRAAVAAHIADPTDHPRTERNDR